MYVLQLLDRGGNNIAPNVSIYEIPTKQYIRRRKKKPNNFSVSPGLNFLYQHMFYICPHPKYILPK